LLEKVNDSPDQKDILDLQTRINAEQLMLQNEQTKLTLMAQLQAARQQTATQQGREMSIKAMRGPLPSGW
jgi:type IV secretion system protein VirB5